MLHKEGMGSTLVKILVVDDEASIVTLLQFNIEKAGFDVVTAEDGRRRQNRIRTRFVRKTRFNCA